MDENKALFNPLPWLWNCFGFIGALTGFASMVEGWFDDALQWKGFIETIVTSYRRLKRPLFDFLLGWLPFSVPDWVGDYLVIGGIVVASFAIGARNVSAARIDIVEIWDNFKQASPKDGYWSWRMVAWQAIGFLMFGVLLVLSLLLWPIVMLSTLSRRASFKAKELEEIYQARQKEDDQCSEHEMFNLCAAHSRFEAQALRQKQFWYWFAAICLCFIVLLMVNARL